MIIETIANQASRSCSGAFNPHNIQPGTGVLASGKVSCGVSTKEAYLTPNHEFDQELKRDVQARVREGEKAVLEKVLAEEMSEQLQVGYRELTPTRRGERNGQYQPQPSHPRRQDRAPRGALRPGGRDRNRAL